MGICGDVLKYPYSTLPGLLGQNRLNIPVVDDLTLFSDVEGTLKWLNRAPQIEYLRAIQAGLRKTEFKLARLNHKPQPLENDAL